MTAAPRPGSRAPLSWWPIAASAVGVAILGMGVAAQTVGGGGTAGTTPTATPTMTPSATAGAATAVPGAASADAADGEGDREIEPPARRLVFNVSQSLDLDTREGSDTLRFGGTTSLGLQAIAETPISTLTFGLTGDLRLRYDLGGGNRAADFEGPVASFRYQRAVPSSSLDVRATYRSRPIAGYSSLDDIDFFDLPPDFVLPDDLNDLVGTGTRTAINASARLTLRDDRPLGFILDASIADVSYTGVTVPGLIDNTLINVGGTVRARFNPVTEGTARAVYTSRTVGDADPLTGVDYAFGLSVDRPLGAITADLSFEQTIDGYRPTFTIGRRLEQPLFRLDARIGATADEAGTVRPSANLSYTRQLPVGELGATLQTGLGTDSAGLERTVTSLTARYRRELTPTTGLTLVALYDVRGATALSAGSSLTEVGATLTRALTEDWSLEASYRHRIRDADDATATSQSSSIGLTIGRSFTLGF